MRPIDKARATLECMRIDRGGELHCLMVDETVEIDQMDLGSDRRERHLAAASLALDGLDVNEVGD